MLVYLHIYNILQVVSMKKKCKIASNNQNCLFLLYIKNVLDGTPSEVFHYKIERRS